MWTTADGTSVQLTVTTKLEEDDTMLAGRIAVTAGATPLEVSSFSLSLVYTPSVEIVLRADGKVLIDARDTGGSGDPGTQHYALLEWDATTKAVRVAEKLDGTGIDDPPAWAAAR